MASADELPPSLGLDGFLNTPKRGHPVLMVTAAGQPFLLVDKDKEK
jgi:hypothetical protein